MPDPELSHEKCRCRFIYLFRALEKSGLQEFTPESMFRNFRTGCPCRKCQKLLFQGQGLRLRNFGKSTHVKGISGVQNWDLRTKYSFWEVKPGVFFSAIFRGQKKGPGRSRTLSGLCSLVRGSFKCKIWKMPPKSRENLADWGTWSQHLWCTFANKNLIQRH